MNTVLVWVLMSYTSSNTGMSYSPPVADLASCLQMQDVAREMSRVPTTKCVEIRILVDRK
jgi:hypothetical protein